MASKVDSPPNKDPSKFAGQVKEMYQKHGISFICTPLAAVVASLVLTGNYELLTRWIFFPAYHFTLTIVGTALGIGLGLGLATHVYDFLTDQANRKEQQMLSSELPPIRSISKGVMSVKHKQSATAAWDEDTIYSSLMASAGYDVSDHVLRAQIIKLDSPFRKRYYSFTDSPEHEFKAVVMMKELMPHLAASVSLSLGKFVEHLMRDYVSSWYSMVDANVPYENERLKRERLALEEAAKAAEELNGGMKETEDIPRRRTMLLSTTTHRPVPMMGSMYTSLTLAFGTLAQRVEGVNILSLLLLKWTKVIAQTLKVYRKLRQKALVMSAPQTSSMITSLRSRASVRKATSSNLVEEGDDKVTPLGVVSEMAVTREFLMHGKLHRAVTFGMDVRSLLFADSKGEVGGNETEYASLDEDEVLEKRLFGTKMLYECEVDYNRVLGNRLARALLPRAEFSSPLLRSMVTELLAGCVLTPIMSCFNPVYLNGWILAACQPAAETTDAEKRKQESHNEEHLNLEPEKEEVMSDDSVEVKSEEIDVFQDLPPCKSIVEDEQGQELTMSMANIISSIVSTDSNPEGQEMTMSQVGSSFDPASKHLVDDGADYLLNSNGEMSYDHDEDDEHGEIETRPEHYANIGADDEDDFHEDDVRPPTGDFILPLLTMSLIELQGFFDFDDCRSGRCEINWDDQHCRDRVTQLVLVLEAALFHGRRHVRLQTSDQNGSISSLGNLIEGQDGSVELSLPKYEPESLMQVLMDMTSNLDGFEERIMKIEDSLMEDDDEADSLTHYNPETILKPCAQELSTTRTLVAAWLHTGQAHRVITVLMNAPNCLLVPFFHKHSFLRTSENAVGFVRQLRSLEAVPILVDTMLVLSSPNMDVNEDGCVITPRPNSKSHGEIPSELRPTPPQRNAPASMEVKQDSVSLRLSRLMGVTVAKNEVELSKSSVLPVPQAFGGPSPKYLDFRKNENFAASLRSERDRRTQSWLSATGTQETTKGVPVICRSKGASEESIAFQRELHQVSRIFYAGTNMISLRSGARRQSNGETPDGSKPEILPLSFLTVEMASQKRRIEVPDEDSSFLLRAQPRPLVAIGVHRDPRNHDQSYKCFAATYEEPVARTNTSRYSGGRFIRRCTLKYYPNDRTASIELPNDGRQLDQRQDRVPDSISLGSTTKSLTNDFLKERHLCQKWTPRGSVPRSGSLLASSVMETTDFTAAPRSGKAIDFVYRVALFERPMVDLDGKKFTVHDSTAVGTHRADASSLEISDAALSLALLQIGRDWDHDISGGMTADINEGEKQEQPQSSRRSTVEVGKDGYPVLFLKYNRKQGDASVTEVKAYRSSYIRAAILITEARQEAQQQCLIKCVLAGSARSATKNRTEALLLPTVTLLDYASSPEREKQSLLLRDLKLGINHIDREQLRRNGLLSPRYPTMIRSLSAQIEGATSVKEPGHAIPAMAPSVVMFRIRCVAIVELCDVEIDEEDAAPYRSSNSEARLFREEWTVWRQFRDFATLHKQLKSQVAQGEQSASAGARLVGAATAAFSVGGTGGGPRRRQALLPSLGQATKTAGLGMTKKSIQKRCGITDSYLKYLLSPNHLLNRCSEVLLFLGAAYPLPVDVVTGGAPLNPASDPFGRIEIVRNIHIADRPVSRKLLHEKEEVAEAKSAHFKDEQFVGSSQTDFENALGTPTAASTSSRSVSSPSVMNQTLARSSSSVRSTVASSSVRKVENVAGRSVAAESPAENEEHASKIAKIKEIQMIPSIKAKIDEVPLSQVRHALFDLIRHQFDFDNASFFRNRMFAALKTMSFAVTTSGEFRKMLYETHTKYVNANALAGWVQFLTDMLWPNGVFMTSSPRPTPDEEKSLAAKSKSALPDVFPDQIKAVIGQNITQNGLDILHEMLQNRMVVKSMAYMLFDLLWLEIFPELQDILTCGIALDEEE